MKKENGTKSFILESIKVFLLCMQALISLQPKKKKKTTDSNLNVDES